VENRAHQLVNLSEEVDCCLGVGSVLYFFSMRRRGESFRQIQQPRWA
jgi:hypothetical protein